MMQIKSLQQRLAIFVLLPVAMFLGGIGAAGYLYIRNALFQEWQEAAILRLERAAHQMDMRLTAPLHRMRTLAKTDKGLPEAGQQGWIIQQLQAQPGVSEVKLAWNAKPQGVAAVSPPQYFYPPDRKVVGLRSLLLDEAGHPLGRLEVLLAYDYLMQDLLVAGWMQSNMACVVDDEGLYLAHSNPAMAARHCLGETQNPLELAMLADLKEKPFGTVIGGSQVIGFYRLKEAPWAIMLHARASRILAPIWRFQFYYLTGGLGCLAVILLLIRLGVGPVVAAIRRIARRSALVARGEYGEPLPVRSQDEIGLLTRSFNDMVDGLKERDFIRNTFGRYMDESLARELLHRPGALRLGGEKRQVAILFSDIRGFTPLAESLSPEATIHLVNRHFSRMIEIIQTHRGIIVDFLGDAILAFFDPLDGRLGQAVEQAVRCALEMQVAQGTENAAAPGLPPLKMGIGLHVGEVVVGNIGSESRAKYGIIGAAVNLTHRLQGQAQGGEVVISEAVYRQAPPGLVIKKEFQARLKGIQDAATLYVVEGIGASPNYD